MTLALLGATLFAGQISCLSKWAPGEAALPFTAGQIATAAVMCLIPAALTEGLAPPSTAGAWAGVLFPALAATVSGMFAPGWGQARMSAARAAVIITMEPVFAGAFAALTGEPMTAGLLLGGAIIVAAIAGPGDTGHGHGGRS